MAPQSTKSRSHRTTPWRFALLATIALAVFMLCASVVIAASGTASNVPDAPALTVEAERTMQGAKLSLRGTGWAAGATVGFTASAPPGATQALDLGSARSNDSGEFRATKLSKCTATTAPDPKAQVTITATAGDQRAEQRVDAALWHCMASR